MKCVCTSRMTSSLTVEFYIKFKKRKVQDKCCLHLPLPTRGDWLEGDSNSALAHTFVRPMIVLTGARGLCVWRWASVSCEVVGTEVLVQQLRAPNVDHWHWNVITSSCPTSAIVVYATSMTYLTSTQR